MTEPTSGFRNGEDFEMKSTAGDGEGTAEASPEAAEKSKPGRKGVTAEQVFAAADSIRASRREPTVDAVQRLLGTGSTGTVAGHLRTWRAAKDGVAPVPSIPELRSSTSPLVTKKSPARRALTTGVQPSSNFGTRSSFT